MDETTLEIEYPIVRVEMNNLYYMVEHPNFKGSKNSNELFLNRHRLFIEQLKRQGFVNSSIDSVGNEGPILVKNMNECWQGFVKHKAMWNPLIVKEQEGKYYAIIGNQRLTCLKAWGWKGLVPCRVADPEDHWDKRCAPRRLYPYVDVK